MCYLYCPLRPVNLYDTWYMLLYGVHVICISWHLHEMTPKQGPPVYAASFASTGMIFSFSMVEYASINQITLILQASSNYSTFNPIQVFDFGCILFSRYLRPRIAPVKLLTAKQFRKLTYFSWQHNLTIRTQFIIKLLLICIQHSQPSLEKKELFQATRVWVAWWILKISTNRLYTFLVTEVLKAFFITILSGLVNMCFS